MAREPLGFPTQIHVHHVEWAPLKKRPGCNCAGQTIRWWHRALARLRVIEERIPICGGHNRHA